MSDDSNAILVFVFLTIVIIGAFLFVVNINYQSKVSECCSKFREYILEGQEGGECYYWSFTDHLKGVYGCVVEDLSVELEESK